MQNSYDWGKKIDAKLAEWLSKGKQAALGTVLETQDGIMNNLISSAKYKPLNRTYVLESAKVILGCAWLLHSN